MSLRWKQLKNKSNTQFRRISGVKKPTFEKIIGTLQSNWDDRRTAGGPSPCLALEDQVLLTLNYWRNYGTYLEIGNQYSVSESTAYKICRWVEDNLKGKEAFRLPGKKVLLTKNAGYDVVVLDVTECPIERPKRKKKGRRKNRQKSYYSGKKKRHTLKQQIVVDHKSELIIATAMATGKTHDFKIFKSSETHVHPEIKTLGDSGYQGLQKLHNNTELPKKKSKKSPLTKEDKEKNKNLSSRRVVVEHVFGFVKKFKIISQKYRNRRRRFGLRFNLICAIYNIECSDKS